MNLSRARKNWQWKTSRKLTASFTYNRVAGFKGLFTFRLRKDSLPCTRFSMKD